jgi:beta-glucosidase
MFESLRGYLGVTLGIVVALAIACTCETSDRARPAVVAGPAWANDPAIEARVEALLARMTLREKLGQLNQLSNGHATGPETGGRNFEQLVAAGEVGSFLNVVGATKTNALQHIAMEKSRLKIPLLFGLDVIHGYRTTFPVPLALASTWDPDVVEHASAVAARESAAEGVRWTFSPMIDIARDPRWGRIMEGAGEDPYLGSVIARAYVRGYQGKKLSDPRSIAACLKHYVGYGAAEAGRDYNTTYIPERLLREHYLAPFHAAVDEGAVTLMSAFNSLNDVPATSNPLTLKQILRDEWGFRGFVVSDWGAIKETIEHGIANDGATAARKSITAGVDMDMESALYINELEGLVEAGKVPVSVVDESVRRILRVKLALGLFERPYTDEAPAPTELAPADVAVAKQAALESFVLLKNTGVLPIAPDVHRIALIGPLADDADNMSGAWTGPTSPKLVTTLKASLEAYASAHGVEVAYARGTDIVGGDDAGIDAAVAAAKGADVVLLAVGESGDMDGEAASRSRLDLPGEQGKLLEAVAKAGKPVVLIVFSGRPLALTPYVDHAGAVVEAWFPGVQAGPALVDVLTGAASFSGRLTATFPRSVGQVPIYYNALNTGRPAKAIDLSRPATGDAKYVSRYLDELNAPLFPFGYGLSYTRFQYGKVTLGATTASAKAIEAGGSITVRATVTNVGSRPGIEVTQLYIRRRGTSVALPVRELKGYRRLSLQPGESREVELSLGPTELAFWNADMKRVVEPSAVSVWIAPDASAGAPAELTLTE